MADRPLQNQEVFQLSTVEGGLRPGTVSFKTLTMQSDHFVCVRDVQPNGQTSLAVADLHNRTSQRHDIKDAEAAIMSPATKVLALRSGSNMQVWNLEAQHRLATHTLQPDETVTFWKWIDATTIAFITNVAVFHWNVETGTPIKMFDRAAELDATVQILNYTPDPNRKWLMLCGVARAADNSLAGKTQIFSVDNGASRVLEGHAGTFTPIASETDPRLANVMCLAGNSPAGGKLMIMELPTTEKPDLTFERKTVSLAFSNPQDFPVALHVSPRHQLLTIVSSRGQAFLVDVHTGTTIISEQVTPHVVFTGCPYEKTGGVMCVNNQGSVFHVSINDSAIARYIYQSLNSPEMALRVASKADLGGVDELFKAQLQNLLMQGNITAAVALCGKAPNRVLRSPEIMNRFKQVPQQPGQPVPISAYFKEMLNHGALTDVESVELARVVLDKGASGVGYIKQLFDEDKVEVSENLGDMVAVHDPELAMRMYHKGNCHHKVVNVLLTRNESQKAVQYCKRMNYSPDWRVILQNFVRINPDNAVQLALMLHNDMGPEPVFDPNDVVDMFLPGQNIKQLTAFLASVLNGKDIPENGRLQTRLLEINLKHSPPSVAEAIFSKGICSHYDALSIAQECERAGLFQRAAECYQKAQRDSDNEVLQTQAVKRCLGAARELNPEWVVEFFGGLGQSESLEYLQELMKNRRQHFKVIVQVAAKFNEALGSESLIDMFLDVKAYDILYYYLGSVVAYSRDPEVHFRYIEAAAEVGQIAEVERMTRESPCYDAERTKNYLKSKPDLDLWPLINVCDKNNFVEELVKFLLDTNNESYIEQFVQRRNPAQAPFVVGALLDCDGGSDLIKKVLTAAGSMCPLEPLIEEVERRGRLKLLQSWLEARRDEKKIDVALHNALGKIYVDINNNPTEFLANNDYYDALVLGKYCENRDPNLSVIAYSKGGCHRELLDVTTKNGMWKQQAKHLVSQQDSDLWAVALKSEGRERENLVEAVQQSLPDSTADEASATVRAFVAAELTHELTSLLDQLVVHGRFRGHRILENLLLMSAIKARPEKVKEYINILEHYDARDIATIATGADLHEEAFTVNHKAGFKKEAIIVILNDLKDLPRARNYAAQCDEAPVWTALAESLLEANEVHDGIEALIRAKNPDFVNQVCEAAERVNEFGDLIKYLTMAREAAKTKDPKIDTYLVLTYAKTGRLSELEEFLKTSHSVQVLTVADKCFADELYDSARVLYIAAANFPKLAATYIKLNNLTAAVDAAQKAQSIRTWKEVNLACLVENETQLAQICAVAIVAQAEELTDLVQIYETAGLWNEMMAVLKTACGQQGAHMGLFTELGVLYAKYAPEKLLEHIKVYPKKINTHKMINVCEKYQEYLVLRVLHINNEDWLAGSNTMMKYPAECWDHEIFKDVVNRLGASDVLYAAITFYIKNHPDLLHDLLMHLVKKVDPERVITEVKKSTDVFFIRKYLEAVQDRNIRKVNDTLNQLYVDEENFTVLRNSVDTYDNFDSAVLSAQLEKMEMFEFRKIALALYRKNKRHFHAIEVAKANRLYQEAMEAAADSQDKELVHNLLKWFVAEGLEDSFAACLYSCYDYLTPHEVMQVAWLNNMTQAAMPYLIQVMQEYGEKVNKLERSVNDAQKAAREANGGGQPGMPTNQGPLMIQDTQGFNGTAPQPGGGGWY